TSGLGLVLGGRSPVVLTGHADASWVYNLATQRSSQGYTFSLGSGSVLWRSTRSSSVLSSSCEAEIYAGAMAAQELRWLTYLLTNLGEPPRSPPVLYVDNKAMLALCREHTLEHRTKHIALRYFLAREVQQRGQLRLAYVASEANNDDIFTKALPPGDHQRFCTMLACFALLDWSCDLFPFIPHFFTLATPAASLAAPCGPPEASCCYLLSALRCPASPRSACLTAMTPLRSSGEGGDGSVGSSEGGGGCSSSRCGAVRWVVSGSGQLQLQGRQHDPLSPQQLREWYACRGGGSGSSGSRCAAVHMGASGGGLAQVQRSPRETLTSHQLREWYVQRGTSRNSARCPYVIRTEFGDMVELPLRLELIRKGVYVFALDYDVILTAMYALTIGAEGDSSLGVQPDLGIDAEALGASESSIPGTVPAEALHTFTLDSGASRCFFCDRTTLTPLSAPVLVKLY
ncbi:unnamed protein product, partial [Closterium sp. NIES-53]